jgi:hypothetical protein
MKSGPAALYTELARGEELVVEREVGAKVEGKGLEEVLVIGSAYDTYLPRWYDKVVVAKHGKVARGTHNHVRRSADSEPPAAAPFARIALVIVPKSLLGKREDIAPSGQFGHVYNLLADDFFNPSGLLVTICHVPFFQCWALCHNDHSLLKRAQQRESLLKLREKSLV